MLEENIEGTKKNIEYQVQRGKPIYFGRTFSKHQKVYGTTNENIEGYITPETVGNTTSALTVLASGDHAFNLVNQGVTNIDTFDTNELTQYFSLGLKKAAILKYDYKDFLKYIRKIISDKTSNEELESIIEGLYPYMEDTYRTYWQSIIEFNHKIQKEQGTNINLFSMLLVNSYRDNLENGYLRDEQNYNNTKQRLKTAHISFKPCDCCNLSDGFNKSYDSILLSNIPDYFSTGPFYNKWGYPELVQFEDSLNPLVNPNGTIFLSYMFLYKSKMMGLARDSLITFSSLTEKDLTDEQILSFPAKGLDKEDPAYLDGMLLVKKK